MKQVVLLFGGRGWIGRKVYDLLIVQGIEVDIATSRADDRESVEKEIDTYGCNITHVMSFIGRTHGTYEGNKIGTIDYLEKPGKLVENVRDNLFAPMILADICKHRGLHFTYLGTGCVFDYDDDHLFGDETTGFKECDEPNFFGSSYSIVKGFTDRLMHQMNNATTLNIRIRMPITDEFNDRNFITKIINYEKICSIPNSMTVLNDLLPVMIELALKKKQEH